MKKRAAAETRLYSAHLAGETISIVSRGPSLDLFREFTAAAYHDGTLLESTDGHGSEPAALQTLLELLAPRYAAAFERRALQR